MDYGKMVRIATQVTTEQKEWLDSLPAGLSTAAVIRDGIDYVASAYAKTFDDGRSTRKAAMDDMLAQLGTDEFYGQLDSLKSRPYDVLIDGPSDSGKTTLMAALLPSLADRDENQVMRRCRVQLWEKAPELAPSWADCMAPVDVTIVDAAYSHHGEERIPLPSDGLTVIGEITSPIEWAAFINARGNAVATVHSIGKPGQHRLGSALGSLDAKARQYKTPDALSKYLDRPVVVVHTAVEARGVRSGGAPRRRVEGYEVTTIRELLHKAY